MAWPIAAHRISALVLLMIVHNSNERPGVIVERYCAPQILLQMRLDTCRCVYSPRDFMSNVSADIFYQRIHVIGIFLAFACASETNCFTLDASVTISG